MSKISRKPKDLKSLGCHESFLRRIRKTLYYGKLPNTDCLSMPVTELASGLFSEPKHGHSIDRLHCKDAAYISRKVSISPCSFVLAMVYLERLKSCNPEYLQTVAPSQLFLVSLMISSKFLYDIGEGSDVILSQWAETGGLSLKELMNLEVEFLDAIDWNVFVDEASFWANLAKIEGSVAKQQGKERGYFTYTELNSLLSSIELNSLLNYLATILAVMVTTYMAGILTIVGSMFIASNIPGSALKSPVNTLSQNDTTSGMPKIDSQTIIKETLDNLQTELALASIQTSNLAGQNEDSHSWDWWNNRALSWLTQTSEFIENVSLIYASKISNDEFLDRSIAECKKLNVEDRFSKHTQSRMQDVLEHSWHTEWTDSFSSLFSYEPLFYYYQQMKA